MFVFNYSVNIQKKAQTKKFGLTYFKNLLTFISRTVELLIKLQLVVMKLLFLY
jgi:hypothetical protein